MNEKRKYDSTVARIAGNIASGLASEAVGSEDQIVAMSVRMARKIVAETERTEPSASTKDHP